MTDSQNAGWTPREPRGKSQRKHAADLPSSSNTGSIRPVVRGKFLYRHDQKLWIRGITYGTFRPDEWGHEFHDPDRVKRDFVLIAEAGINAIRTYTVPPRWFLDLACDRGLYVMVGLPWEQHIAFLDDRQHGLAIRKRVRESVRL